MVKKLAYISGIGVLLLVVSSALGDPKEDAKKTLAELTRRGVQSIQAGDCPVALESLLDGYSAGYKAQLPPTDLREVQHYIAIAYMKRGLYDKATPFVTRSIANKPAGLLEITNLAVFDLKTKKDVIRSVWNLKDYLATQEQIEEGTLILLGSCMDMAAETSKVSANAKRFNEAANFYLVAQRKLELTRKDGMRLWGSTWISSQQMGEIEEKKAQLQRDIESTNSDRRYWESELKRFESNAENERQENLRNMRPNENTSWDGNINDARTRLKGYKDKVASLSRQFPKPDFPKELTVKLPGAEVSKAGSIKTPESTEKSVNSKPAQSPGKPLVTSPKNQKKEEPSPSQPAEPAAPTLAIRTFAAFAVGPETLVAPFDVSAAESIAIELLPKEAGQPKCIKSDKKIGLSIITVPGAHFVSAPIATTDYSGDLECVGFPTASLFMSAVEHVKGKSGKPTPGGWFVSMGVHPRLSGAPLVDANGNVVGMTNCTREDLASKIPAITAGAINGFLSDMTLAPSKGRSPDVYQVTISYHPDSNLSKPAGNE